MSEILINTTTAGVQHQPGACNFGVELYFVVWRDDNGDIKGRFFDDRGKPSKSEFGVNVPTNAANTDRNFPVVESTLTGPVVVWIESAFNPPGPRPHVKLRRYDGEGQPIGSEIQVSTNDVDPKHRPGITGMIDGGFLVCWADARANQRIRAQRFSDEGVKIGPEIGVNATEGFHEDPIATRLVDGNYVIAWRSDPSPPGGGALIFRIFDLFGSPVTSEITPNLVGFEKAMTLVDDGRFVIAHVRSQGVSDIGVEKSSVEANVFDANGALSNTAIPISSERGINSSWPAIALLQGGRFVLTWVQKSAETFVTSPIVKAAVFSASEGSVGPEVQVNTTTAVGRSELSIATIPSTPSTAFIAWTDHSRTSGDVSVFDVRGRVFRVVFPGTLIARPP